MKKVFTFYTAIWVVLLALFNVIVFVVPRDGGIAKAGGAFWFGYFFITVAFLGQLVCAWIALKQNSLHKLFYHIPLITISFTGLLVSVVAGTLCMAVPGFPMWAGIVICGVVLAFSIVSILKASVAAELVQDIEDKTKEKTFFIRSLTVVAESLLARATDPETKTVLKEVFEAVRYSDPMGHTALAGLESQITMRFCALSAAVDAQKTETVKAAANELIVLINDRNKKCELLK